jgi:hypothetical protein
MLQEAIISARKELEAAKLSAKAEVDAKRQQLLDIRQEAEILTVDPRPQAAELVSGPSSVQPVTEHQDIADQISAPQEDSATGQHAASTTGIHEVAPSDAKMNAEVPAAMLKQNSGMSDVEERLKFGAGPHCEGSRSPKKRPPEKTGLVSIEVIQAEHQAQRECWAKALVAHEEELMQERELRTREAAEYQEKLEIGTAHHVKELAEERQRLELEFASCESKLAEEKRHRELEFSACESKLAEERELKREQAAANAELKLLLEKSAQEMACWREQASANAELKILLESSAQEVASLRAALRAKEAETALCEQHAASATPSVGSAALADVKAKPAGVPQPRNQQKITGQLGTGLARRLFEGDAPIAPPSQERTPKWPTPAPAALVACDATDEPVNPVQGSVLKRINAFEAVKHYELSTRAASQPPPVLLGAKPNLHQDASETTPRGKVSGIRHQLERRGAAPPTFIERPCPSTSPRTAPRNPSWRAECSGVGNQSSREVRWVKGNSSSATTSSLVKERVRRLENQFGRQSPS